MRETHTTDLCLRNNNQVSLEKSSTIVRKYLLISIVSIIRTPKIHMYHIKTSCRLKLLTGQANLVYFSRGHTEHLVIVHTLTLFIANILARTIQDTYPNLLSHNSMLHPLYSWQQISLLLCAFLFVKCWISRCRPPSSLPTSFTFLLQRSWKTQKVRKKVT